jgi:hypothetical protein
VTIPVNLWELLGGDLPRVNNKFVYNECVFIYHFTSLLYNHSTTRYNFVRLKDIIQSPWSNTEVGTTQSAKRQIISQRTWLTSGVIFSTRPGISNKICFYFLQSPYLFTIDRLFLSIVEMFRINFYRVSLDFSFRNTKLIVVYVIERTPIRYLFLHLMLKISWKSDKEWLHENVMKINGFIWNI